MKSAIFIIGLLLATCYCQEESSATALLESLVLESEQSLSDLRSEWQTNQPLLQGALQSVLNQRNAQLDECQQKDLDLQNVLTEIEQNEHYVGWIANRIQENNRRVTELEENRCNASLLYVNGLKHNKIAVKLLEFLRQAVEARDSLDLVQRQQIMGKLQVFAQLYSDSKFKEMIQNFQVEDSNYNVRIRTEADIGTGHIDEHPDQIDVANFESSVPRSWPQYRAELLALIDHLHSEISEQLERAQDDEMNAGISLAEFGIHVGQENRMLVRHLDEEQERHTVLVSRRAVLQNLADTCNAQLEVAEAQLTTAQATYDAEVAAFEEKKQGLQEEIRIFRQVYGMYQLHVGDNPQDRTGREVDQFDFIRL